MGTPQHCEELDHQLDLFRQRIELLQDCCPRPQTVANAPAERDLEMAAFSAPADRLASALLAGMPDAVPQRDLYRALETAGALCHQLNQPIQCISGYAELLMMDMDKAHPAYGKLEQISTQVDRVSEIVRNIMELIRNNIGRR